jgi:F-type H+-transporting ATPase subunit a
LQILVETVYFFVKGIIVENINIYYYYKNLKTFLFFLFLILVLADLSGIIPYTFTITSHLLFTFTLSTIVIFLVNSILIERYGFIALRFFLPSGAPIIIVPFLVIIEIVSYSARVFSLGIRLFANMMSGHILLKIFGEFSFALGLLGLPLNLLITGFYYLEGLIAILQAYVFLILTCIYFKEAIYLH